jgi:hypothetical protein
MIGGGLPPLTGTAPSGVVASAPEESVSIVDARRGAKKLRVTSFLVRVFMVSAPGFLEVGASSVVLCCLHLRTSWKSSSFVYLTVVSVPPAELLAFSRDLSSLRATVLSPIQRTEE